MTRTELEEEISRLLGDPSNTRWSTSIIDTRIEHAQIAVQKQARAQKTTTNYTPTANTAAVSIGSSVIDILRATYTLSDGTIKGPGTRFDPINRWLLDVQRPNWQNESAGEPVLWFMDASNQQVILIPKPDSTAAVSNALTLIEVRTPATLSSSSSVPFDSSNLMVPYHRSIVYWVVAECLRDNQDADSLNKAKYFRSDNRQNPGLFEVEMKMILSLFDVPEAQPARITPRPQGGRISSGGRQSKRDPLAWS